MTGDAQQGTQVVGLHAGFIDTDLLDALERGDSQVLADEITRKVHRGLSADFPAFFQSTDALGSRAG